MKQYKTCNGCKASEELEMPGKGTWAFVCRLGYNVGWAGNPEEPCPKPRRLNEYRATSKKVKDLTEIFL